MRIGELARRAGASARSIRYYEQQGLLLARRRDNGYRDYDEADLRLVREIRSLLVNGFDLEEIRPFIDCLDSRILELQNLRDRVAGELSQLAAGSDEPQEATG